MSKIKWTKKAIYRVRPKAKKKIQAQQKKKQHLYIYYMFWCWILCEGSVSYILMVNRKSNHPRVLVRFCRIVLLSQLNKNNDERKKNPIGKVCRKSMSHTVFHSKWKKKWEKKNNIVRKSTVSYPLQNDDKIHKISYKMCVDGGKGRC